MFNSSHLQVDFSGGWSAGDGDDVKSFVVGCLESVGKPVDEGLVVVEENLLIGSKGCREGIAEVGNTVPSCESKSCDAASALLNITAAGGARKHTLLAQKLINLNWSCHRCVPGCAC